MQETEFVSFHVLVLQVMLCVCASRYLLCKQMRSRASGHVGGDGLGCCCAMLQTRTGSDPCMFFQTRLQGQDLNGD